MILYNDFFELEAELPEIIIEEGLSIELSEKYGPAPNLTELEITHVGSTLYGKWELISKYQSITKGDHGGSFLGVVTVEIGYGSIKVAKMNGKQLPSSANYKTYYLCKNPYGQIVHCSPGQTVVGFQRYWDVSGYESGYFTYQNTSTNAPHNTMKDAISIR